MILHFIKFPVISRPVLGIVSSKILESLIYAKGSRNSSIDLDNYTHEMMTIVPKESVQGTGYSDSTCLYSAFTKPNMIIKTKKLSIFWKLFCSDM